MMFPGNGTRNKRGSCKICHNPDNDWMVQCDNRGCNSWWHLSCVGLKEHQARAITWFCPSCKAKRDKQKDDSRMDSLITFDNVASSTWLPPDNSKKLEYHSDFGFDQDDTLVPDTTIKQRPDRKVSNMTQEISKMSLSNKTKKPEGSIINVGAKSTISKTSSRNSKHSHLQERLELLKQRQELFQKQEDNIQEQLKVLEDVEKLEEQSDTSSEDLKERLKQFEISPVKIVKSSPTKPKVTNPLNIGAERFIPIQQIPREVPKAQPSNTEFNMQQWTARHALPKNLPVFTGKSEEWPPFISAFDHANVAAGYTNVENLPRLEFSIRGIAREFVKNLFASPDNVPLIIQTLKRMFGRPEQMLSAQLDELRKQAPPTQDKPDSIMFFAASVQNMWASMKSAEMDLHMNNPMLMQELVNKLPQSLRMQWANQLFHSPNNIETFVHWLNTLVDKICLVNPTLDLTSARGVRSVDKSVSKPKQDDPTKKKTAYINMHETNSSNKNNQTQTPRPKCVACNGSCSSLELCQKFIASNGDQRWNIIKSNGICKQCLKHHFLKPPYRCSSRINCTVVNCSRSHHTLMHREPKKEEHEKITPEVNCTHQTKGYDLQFRYLPVILKNGEHVVRTFAFLDEGSTGTFMDNEIAKLLKVSGPESTLCVKYTSNKTHTESKSMRVSFSICGLNKDAPTYAIEDVQTIEDLSMQMQDLNYEDLVKEFPHLKGLPISSYQNARPQILIGLNNWHLAVPTRIRMNEERQPIAARCKLGWTVFAASSSKKQQTILHCTYQTSDSQAMTNDERLHELMKFYYSLESLGVRPPPDHIASLEYRRANQIMNDTTQRVNGRIETGLLWKANDIKLPPSRGMAIRRLHCLEARTNRDPELKKAVHEQMQSFIDKGYLRKLSKEELTAQHERVWYLPIFPVRNPNKPGRIRMVFDAAAMSEGVSLNSMLMQGPDLISCLIGIMLRFRQYPVAVSGDIKDMFMRILVTKEDQHCQRIVFRTNVHEQPEDYVLQVLTFGSTCSPTSAMYVKNFNAKQFEKEYPRAVQAICENHYVDDFMDSLQTEEEVIQLASQVKALNQKAGFEMHHWRSNSSKVMAALGEEMSGQIVNMTLESENMEKVLGMWWVLNSDSFTYSLKFNKGNEQVLKGEIVPTKRDVLKVLMSLYDPLGLVSHFTSYLKVLLQDIWRSKVGWDEKIEESHFKKWLCWLSVLNKIEELRIPRCYLKNVSNYENATTTLHIFVDASKDCSTAAAYLRIQEEEVVEVVLLMAKSRVAPMKLVSIPKLELIAALLGARISKTVVESLSIKPSGITLWSDSRTVLLWLRSDPRHLKGQFEQFKVAEIQSLTRTSDWRYVPSRMNVADDGTKWERDIKLNSEERWFKGPSFLYKSEQEWPEDITLNRTNTTEEVTMVHQVIRQIPTINYTYCSKWKQLVKSIAIFQQYMKILQMKIHQRKDPKIAHKQLVIGSDELYSAQQTLIRVVQREAYHDEIATLKKERKDGLCNTVSRNSSIFHLSPTLRDEILVVKSRIGAVLDPSPYLTKDLKLDSSVAAPIIMPRNHPATQLLVQKYHEKRRHIQDETVVNDVRREYYIPRLRQLLKSIRKNCPRCKMLTTKPIPPEMSVLPKARLSPYTLPFTYTGIDCMGPIEVAVGRRHEKRWVVLFTCMTTRAVHLEIIHGMDHDSFIMALRNFMQRRGEPREIFSDNGTNFVKGERILREHYEQLNLREISKEFVSPELKWHFNPPESPHFGGVWERLVRSIKHAFYAILPVRTPDDQRLRNYLMECENIVNSRPLTYIPLSHENDEALTPNHFLRGASGGGKPIVLFDHDPVLLKSHYLNAQQDAQRFWNRWVSEYMPELTRRSKWHEPCNPLQEGDIVLIVDPKTIRNNWQKGRIEKVMKGSDGQVRSAVVRTSTGLLTRPSVKLAKLDILDQSLESKQDCSRNGGESVTESSTTPQQHR